MKKLSVVIITLNEERNIGRCLASVQGVADEIVVVDSFSTDNTEAICREYGARFIQHPFGGYIEQKQYALEQAYHPMVLSLDADELLSEKLLKSIVAEKKKGFPQQAYKMNRLSNYCGKWIRYSSWYPDTKLRLFDKKIGYWGGSNPHDKVLLKDEQLKPYQLTGDILHYTFGSIQEHIHQINRFSEIKARVAFENKRKSRWYHLVFSARIRFLRDYILKLGILDGFYGYIICRNSAHATFLKYSKLRQIQHEQKSAKNE